MCADNPIRRRGAVVECHIFSMTYGARRAPTLRLTQSSNKRGECDEQSRVLGCIAGDGARRRPLDYWIICADLRSSFVPHAVSEQRAKVHGSDQSASAPRLA